MQPLPALSNMLSEHITIVSDTRSECAVLLATVYAQLKAGGAEAPLLSQVERLYYNIMRDEIKRERGIDVDRAIRIRKSGSVEKADGRYLTLSYAKYEIKKDTRYEIRSTTVRRRKRK